MKLLSPWVTASKPDPRARKYDARQTNTVRHPCTHTHTQTVAHRHYLPGTWNVAGLYAPFAPIKHQQYSMQMPTSKNWEHLHTAQHAFWAIALAPRMAEHCQRHIIFIINNQIILPILRRCVVCIPGYHLFSIERKCRKKNTDICLISIETHIRVLLENYVESLASLCGNAWVMSLRCSGDIVPQFYIIWKQYLFWNGKMYGNYIPSERVYSLRTNEKDGWHSALHASVWPPSDLNSVCVCVCVWWFIPKNGHSPQLFSSSGFWAHWNSKHCIRACVHRVPAQTNTQRTSTRMLIDFIPRNHIFRAIISGDYGWENVAAKVEQLVFRRWAFARVFCSQSSANKFYFMAFLFLN